MSPRGHRRKESAGLLMFRRTNAAAAGSADAIEVLLGHPGGPYWIARDLEAWTIPKGGIHPGEGPLDTALREFREETGFETSPPYLPLGYIVQRSGKTVHAWAFEGDADPAALTSEMTSTEWPPRSGKWIQIPEIDRAAFFTIAEARRRINPAQVALLDRLLEHLSR
jgi:predicted NUDIX family NTP pyrophosphohydrolase